MPVQISTFKERSHSLDPTCTSLQQRCRGFLYPLKRIDAAPIYEARSNSNNYFCQTYFPQQMLGPFHSYFEVAFGAATCDSASQTTNSVWFLFEKHKTCEQRLPSRPGMPPSDFRRSGLRFSPLFHFNRYILLLQHRHHHRLPHHDMAE
nr:unnamed protein product [Spirometra erinaceieuropaei]